jgi:streptogramin lyase
MKTYLALFIGLFVAGQLAVAVEDLTRIEGTGSLSGRVIAPNAFKAAKVYAKNIEKRMLYMVYTKDGLYHAINLLPGNYEVWVEKESFIPGSIEKVYIEATDHLQLNLSLKKPDPEQTMSALEVPTMNIPAVPYESLYPDGPGLAVAERTCIVCHGGNFLPSFHLNTKQWDAFIGRMMRPEKRLVSITSQERKELAEYLGNHFGPNSDSRTLKIDVEIPLDEDALSTAMFIEYLLPEGRSAHDPAIDHEGNVWYSDMTVPTSIGKLDPRTAEITNYDLPYPTSYPEGLIVDKLGYVFWCEPGGGVIARLDPRTNKMDRFPHGVPNGRAHTPVEDANGDIWFTLIVGNSIGKWDRETETIQVWEVPTSDTLPYGIVVKDERIWFAEFFRGGVGMFNAKTEQFTEYPTLVQPGSVRRVGIDSDGQTVWYGVFNQGKLGKLDIKTGQQVEYDLLPKSGPYGVKLDADDIVWTSDGLLGGELIRFDPKTKKTTYYPVPRPTDMPKLDISHEGAVWYTTRSNPNVALGVLWPDVSKMKNLSANR